MAKNDDSIPLDYFRKTGAQGGKKAAASMTPEERSARAKKAVDAREAKRKQGKGKKRK